MRVIRSRSLDHLYPLPDGLDLLAFGVILLVVVLSWLPTLTSGGNIVPSDDFLMPAARYEAVRKSLIEHHTFPLRSHWFGGGYPTLGEPGDPALNPLVLLSVVFGSVMPSQALIPREEFFSAGAGRGKPCRVTGGREFTHRRGVRARHPARATAWRR